MDFKNKMTNGLKPFILWRLVTWSVVCGSLNHCKTIAYPSQLIPKKLAASSYFIHHCSNAQVSDAWLFIAFEYNVVTIIFQRQIFFKSMKLQW